MILCIRSRQAFCEGPSSECFWPVGPMALSQPLSALAVAGKQL